MEYMNTHQSGLTQTVAEQRLSEYGLNVLPEKKPPSDLTVFFSQLKSPLIYVLIFAGVITFFLRHYSDSIIILASVLINTVLGFIQEKKANQAFIALKNFVTQTTEVIRDGQRLKIDVSAVVPGDIVMLVHGAKVPADGVLTYSNRAYFDEAIITGESLPVAKTTQEAVFMGTTVSAGQAEMEVITTGSHTKIGGIAESIQELDADTPLKRQLSNLSKKLVIVVLSLISIVLVTGLLRGNDATEMFTTAVALAVSSIPEGLAVSLTVVLAIGMQRLLKRKGLVKKLTSAETLGGVTTICIDKTGTLTQGKMQVVHHIGSQAELAEQVILANDLDDPIVIAAYEWGKDKVSENLLEKHPRLDSIPFSSQERFFCSLNEWSPTKNMLFVNGAPDVLLTWTDLSKKEKKRITKQIDELTSQGKRLIGFAQKEVSKNKTELSNDDAKSELKWVGLIAFYDPVRPSVKTALEQTKQAGITLIVITGDYANTTQHVLAEIGQVVAENQIMLGEELEKLSIAELSEKLKTIRLFARTTPNQKHAIVTALKKNGEIVAMMGDGVNDAPAIHKADIGIAVNEASDVAKESASLILLDSNFSTVIAAIEEGRGIFDNIRKVILYLLSDAFAEIIVVMGGIILGLPLPITAVQIIWINLVSDGFPGLALTIDPKSPDIMSQPPRPPQEKLVNSWMVALIGTVSVVAGIIALTTYVMTLKMTGNVLLARSVCFATLGMNSLAYVFSVRTLTVPFWKTKVFENKWLLLAVAAGFCLQITPFISPATNHFFGVVPLSLNYWLLAISLSITVFMTVEIFKYFVAHFLTKK
jgi:P-type Ca2+ transporter type 2C